MRSLLMLAGLAALVLPAGASAATRTKDISPYKTFTFQYTASRPDAPTRVLLAVIAKHPEAVEDVLRKAS